MTRKAIYTEEELGALPIGTVIISQVYGKGNGYQCSFQRIYTGNWHRGGRSDSTHPDYFLPATVIWEPEQ